MSTENSRIPAHVVVGSINPVKVNAVRTVLQGLQPGIEIVGVEVPSGVSIQPMSDQETELGALNRARAAVALGPAEWGIGLEGGLRESKQGLMTTAWCAIADREGRTGVGGTASMLLPPSVARRIREGAELGEAMDEFAGIDNVRRKMGAIGVLTRGLTDRQQAYEFLLKLALVRFLWRQEFER